jgi:pimeloyl-ACP methyl ester carboxylesterase
MRSHPSPLSLLAALLAAAPAAAPAAPPGSLRLTPCHLAHPVSVARVPARCGSLEVPEDSGRPDGRKIALRVAVLPADAPQPAPDPVLVLAGGPGQSVTEVYPQIAPAFARLNRDRDIVLVDQRGTGGSGRLACPAMETVADDVVGTGTNPTRLAAECAAALDADPTQYTTAAFVRDLEAVRSALGHDRVNLVGFSYGTRAALAYARAYPDRARTLVLDGVAPFEMLIGADFDRDSQQALETLFRRCADDPACRARYPALEQDFRALLSRLERHPEKVRVRDPLTGEPRDLTLDGDGVRQVVLGFLYTPETAALLPTLLRQARDGDLAPLAAQGLLVATDLQAGMSRPLQLSVLCAEDVPFYPAAATAGPGGGGGPEGAVAGVAAQPTFLGDASRQAFRRLCAGWPRAEVEASFHAAVALQVPALLLSGGADPVTPPRWAETAARSLPRSRQIVLPGSGHGVFARGCMPRVVTEFVKAASADGLDLACLDRLRPSPVFIDLQGAAP